jgi:hypothetical protein
MSSWLFVLIFMTKLLQRPTRDKVMNFELYDFVAVIASADQIFTGAHILLRPAGNRKYEVRQKEADFY